MNTCTIPLKEIVQSGFHLNKIINNKPCIFCKRIKISSATGEEEEEENEDEESIDQTKDKIEVKEKQCLKCAEYLKRIEELESKIAEYSK